METAGVERLNEHEAQPLLAEVLGIAQALAAELHPAVPALDCLDADASIERQFGLDSLARVELASRIEQRCGVMVSAETLATADTVRELVQALQKQGARPPPRVQADLETAAAAAILAPSAPTTLLETLEWHSVHQPDRTYILFADDEAAPDSMTFGELRSAAKAVATGLIERGTSPREPVAIMLPTGRDFFAAFFGVLYARGVPVPLYPPARPSQIESHLRRAAGILANCGARTFITFDAARRAAQLLRSLTPGLESLVTVADISRVAGAFEVPPASATDIAFLQYTSGSTGQPKGVVLTHANLLANLGAMQRATGVSSKDCFVSWLPLYHDMGLIGACLGALVIGFPLVLMSPFTFLAHPVRWLRTIDRHRATLTAAPNFAYELCNDKIRDAELEGLDLGSLRYAFNGAEAVSPHTLERFAARFTARGLAPAALAPVYGLAECALGLTFPPPGRGPLVDHIDRATFQRTGVARHTTEPEPRALPVVSCGRPIAGHSIRIVDAAGRPLPERRQGRIQFQGPSATSGYFNNPAETARLFEGNWLDSGDLGYLAEGELYVTGRAKDIIIRGGHNIHPQELEEAISGLPEVRKGGVVVFPATDRRHATERIVALVETREHRPRAPATLIAQVNRLAVDLIGLPIDEVVLAPARTVLKTSSGKIRRAACRDAYEHGKLGAGGRPPWLQVIRVLLDGLRIRARRVGLRVAALLWGLRVWLVAGCLAPLVWIIALATPTLARRRRVCRGLARLTLRLAGIGIGVTGEATARAPLVYVTNHASYLDAVVMMSVLPAEVVFVAKREFAGSRWLGPLLRRLDCLFVEREDVQEAVATAGGLRGRLAAGDSLLVFVEGTFHRDPGLLPFHMGAFIAAAASGSPVVPVALCGTRSMLPDGAWLPRPAAIEMFIGSPALPTDAGWSAAVELRKHAREFILEHLHEPDLEQIPRAVAASAKPAPK